MSKLELLKKHNFTFNKSYGQNFIFDTNLLESIVEKVNVHDKIVLEIGPGAGTLTRILAKYARKVVAYEIDTNLKPILQENLAECNNVEVIYGDIMKISMSDIEKTLGDKYIIVANLPYYITTPIIFKFLENANNMQSMSIMVQKEVADRLVAQPNTKDYGAITASIDYRGNAKIIKNVGRQMFTPPPNVDSAIVKIDLDSTKYNVTNTKTLDKTIACVFAMRRKTIENNLKATFGFDGDTADKIVSQAGITKGLRGEVLSTQQLVNLANTINNYINSKT